MKGFQRALGGLYQSVLRAELTARYGVVFGEIVKGQAEIAGMPEGLLEEFSKRSVQVERAYQRLLADFCAREGRGPISKEDGAMRRHLIGLSCRVYTTPNGPAGSPTLDELRAVLVRRREHD